MTSGSRNALPERETVTDEGRPLATDGPRMASLILDADGIIRSMTPDAEMLLNLSDANLGQQITLLGPHLGCPDIAACVGHVRSSGAPLTREVQGSTDTVSCQMTIAPLAGTAGEDGFVLTVLEAPAPDATNPDVKTLNKILRDRVNELETLLEVSPVGIVIATDPECREIRANRRAMEMMREQTHSIHVPSNPDSTYRILVDDEPVPDEDLPLQYAARTGQPMDRFEACFAFPDGDKIDFLAASMPLFDDDGTTRGAICAFEDITEQKESQRIAQHRAAQQGTVARLGGMALKGMSADELMEKAVWYVSQTLDVPMCKILRVSTDGSEFVLSHGVGWRDGWVGNFRLPLDAAIQSAYTLESRRPVVVEDVNTETRFPRGALLTEHGVVSGITVAIRSEERPWGVLGVHTTAHRQFSRDDANFLLAVANRIASTIEKEAAEHTQKNLLRELQHRVKNNLATVASLAKQTLRSTSDPQEFVDNFQGRLMALSRLHDVLAGTNWEKVDLHTIIDQAVTPFVDTTRQRWNLTGDNALFKPEAALPLALSFHEMTTNAVKHGALAGPDGRIDITTERDASGTGASMHITWRETAGHETDRPPAHGFGLTYLEQTVTQQLEGTVSIEFTETGIRYILDVPLTGDTAVIDNDG